MSLSDPAADRPLSGPFTGALLNNRCISVISSWVTVLNASVCPHMPLFLGLRMSGEWDLQPVMRLCSFTHVTQPPGASVSPSVKREQ